MAVLFEYTGYVEPIPESEIPQDVLDEWKETLKAERDRIKANLLEKIATETDFKSKIAEASADAYANFVNPNFEGADMIKLKQRIKLMRAYNPWKAGVESAFAEGGTFEKNVEAKADKFKAIRYVLGVVGHKPDKGYGAVVKGVMFHTGEKIVLRYITAEDSYTGTPTPTLKTAFVKFVKPMIVAKAVQACVLAIYANEGGDSSTRDSILSNVTNDINTILDAFKRDDVTFSQLAYELTWDTNVNKIKVHAIAETST